MFKKITAAFGGLFTGLGGLGLWGTCHGICQLAIAGLALAGITVVGMPLAFLSDSRFIQLAFFVGGALIALSLILYWKQKKACLRE